MKISVIVPIYNVAKHIEKCARSLFAQTLDNIEYIFVNDCTPDNSIELLSKIIDEYPSRKANIKIVHHEVNRGLTVARNTGVEYATGDFIAHCDSDDWVECTMYEDLLNAIIEDNADIAICDINMVFPSHSFVYHSVDGGVAKEVLNQYITLEWTCAVNMIVKKEIYDKHNIKSPNDIIYCEDFHLTTRLLYYAKKVAKTNKALYNYNRFNANSITHNLTRERQMDRCRCDQSLIEFLTQQTCIDFYIQSIAYRILSYKQDWALTKEWWPMAASFCPQVDVYLWSCPRIKWWRKIVLWGVLNHHYYIPNFIIYLRNLKHKAFNE